VRVAKFEASKWNFVISSSLMWFASKRMKQRIETNSHAGVRTNERHHAATIEGHHKEMKIC
jgi:hypothetical protein